MSTKASVYMPAASRHVEHALAAPNHTSKRQRRSLKKDVLVDSARHAAPANTAKMVGVVPPGGGNGVAARRSAVGDGGASTTHNMCRLWGSPAAVATIVERHNIAMLLPLIYLAPDRPMCRQCAAKYYPSPHVFSNQSKTKAAKPSSRATA